jgi:DNA polymerase elongation subunit (family B)
VFDNGCTSKLAIQNNYLYARMTGMDAEIKYHDGSYSLNYKSCFNERYVTNIINLGPTKDYVYDLETQDGTFQAGIGQMIVKNTDSCYVIFPQPVDPDGTLTTLFKVAENAAKRISETFKKPIELEFEKFMYPYTGIAKKRYIYLEWTNPKKHNGEIEAKGVELVRRDNCPYVKETLNAILNPIMFENNIEKGVEEAKIHINRLFNGEVPIKKLILSKTLRNDYKGFEKKYSQRLLDGRPDTNGPYKWIHTKEIKVKQDGKNVKTGNFEQIEEVPNMGHVALVERMRERDANGAPRPGDRIPFVYIDTGNPSDTSAQKTEDPEYVIANNIPIDNLYYFDHQLSSPIENIMGIIIGQERCKKLLYENPSYKDAVKREKIAVSDHKRKSEKNMDIRNFFTIKLK